MCVCVYRVPGEARLADNRGPTFEAYTLSKSDKKYIVKFYSDLGQGIPVCMAYSRIRIYMYTVIHVTKKIFSVQMVKKAMKM